MKVELETVDHQDKLPLRVFAHSIRRTALHAHPEIELLLALKGTVFVSIDTKSYTLGPGDLALINGGSAHLTQNGDDENVLVAVQIDLSFAEKYDSDIGRRRFGFNDKYERTPDAPVFSRMRGICARLLWETRLKKSGYRIACESLALELLSMLIRDFESAVPPEEQARADPDFDSGIFYARINRIVAAVERDYRERLSLADIARREGVNMAYLSRFFKDKMGYSFTEFVQFIRLKKSLAALEESDRKILDIALDCGFPNVKSYNMVFKRTYKRTPAQWRAELATRESAEPPDRASNSDYVDHDDGGVFALLRPYLQSS